MRIRSAAAGIVLGLGLAAAAGAARAEETREQRDARMAWWIEARFGMFIHWDMSSLAGTEISWSRKGTKPLDITGHKAGVVEDPAYDNLYKRFNPEKFDAAAWMRLAREAGMKYVVFTAKHHGGFCMWDTKLTDYSIMHTPFKHDVVRELADACHKAGLRFGLYYSPRDWHHPDYGIGDNRKYVEYMNGQVRELLTNYAPVDVIWWDSYGKGDLVSFWGIGETFDLVKKLNPAIVMNNRLAVLGAYNRQPAPYLGDHDTPEQRLGEFQNTRPWESCMTVVHCADGGGWSYRPDGKVRSRAECIRSLASCVTGDGNLLLDVGPNATGVIPEDQADRLREMGEWLKTCGPAVYGTRGGPYRNGRWGGSTHKGNTVYLHVFSWGGDRLALPPLKAKVLKAANLSSPQYGPALEQTAEAVTLTLAPDRQDPVDTVLELTLDGPARDEMADGRPIEVAGGRPGAAVKQAADGSLTLTAESAAVEGKTARLQESGGRSNIGYWSNTGDSLRWSATVAKPGTFTVELTWSCQPGSEGSEFTVTAGDRSVAGRVEATKGWDDWRTAVAGEIALPTPGPVTVVLKPTRKPGAAVMNLAQVRLVPK
jgi:alpha-L-fucosidase